MIKKSLQIFEVKTEIDRVYAVSREQANANGGRVLNAMDFHFNCITQGIIIF